MPILNKEYVVTCKLLFFNVKEEILKEIVKKLTGGDGKIIEYDKRPRFNLWNEYYNLQEITIRFTSLGIFPDEIPKLEKSINEELERCFLEEGHEMKNNFTFKPTKLNLTFDDIKEEIRKRIGTKYDFKVNNYKVTLNTDTKETTVYVEYTKFLKTNIINVGKLKMPHELYEALLNDNEPDKFEKTFNQTIVRALENYYGLKDE